MRLVSAGDVCRVLSTKKANFPHQTLDSWVKRGIVTPAVDARGTGNHRMFTITQVLGMAVGRGLRSRGISLEVAGEIMQHLMDCDEDDLVERFKRRRCYVVILGDEVCPELMTQNSFERYATTICKDTGLIPVAIDVKTVYERILTVVKEKHGQPA